VEVDGLLPRFLLKGSLFAGVAIPSTPPTPVTPVAPKELTVGALAVRDAHRLPSFQGNID